MFGSPRRGGDGGSRVPPPYQSGKHGGASGSGLGDPQTRPPEHRTGNQPSGPSGEERGEPENGGNIHTARRTEHVHSTREKNSNGRRTEDVKKPRQGEPRPAQEFTGARGRGARGEGRGVRGAGARGERLRPSRPLPIQLPERTPRTTWETQTSSRLQAPGSRLAQPRLPQAFGERASGWKLTRSRSLSLSAFQSPKKKLSGEGSSCPGHSETRPHTSRVPGAGVVAGPGETTLRTSPGQRWTHSLPEAGQLLFSTD